MERPTPIKDAAVHRLAKSITQPLPGHYQRSYGNLTPRVRTLWVRVKRHAIHHWLYKLCTEDMWKVTARSHGRGREHSTYCGKNLVCDHPVSQYWSSDLSFQTSGCWPVIVVFGSVLHLILDST